jgi:hypothetical protein
VSAVAGRRRNGGRTAGWDCRRLRATTVALMAAALLTACHDTSAGQTAVMVGVTPADCVAPDASVRARLDEAWQPFLPFTRACTVRSPERQPALLLVSVWAERYYEDSRSAVQAAMPKPLLLTTSGATVGRLPFNYPDDPPAALTVTFHDWRDGFPRRIELFVKDPAALGDRALPPLRWNETSRQFVAER